MYSNVSGTPSAWTDLRDDPRTAQLVGGGLERVVVAPVKKLDGDALQGRGGGGLMGRSLWVPYGDALWGSSMGRPYGEARLGRLPMVSNRMF